MIAVAARSIKSVNFSHIIAVHTDDLAKNQFWHVATNFETCVLNPFQGQNMKENVFLTGSREDRY